MEAPPQAAIRLVYLGNIPREAYQDARMRGIDSHPRFQHNGRYIIPRWNDIEGLVPVRSLEPGQALFLPHVSHQIADPKKTKKRSEFPFHLIDEDTELSPLAQGHIDHVFDGIEFIARGDEAIVLVMEGISPLITYLSQRGHKNVRLNRGKGLATELDIRNANGLRGRSERIYNWMSTSSVRSYGSMFPWDTETECPEE